MKKLFLGFFLFLSFLPSVSSYQAVYYADSFIGQKTVTGEMVDTTSFSAAFCESEMHTLIYARYHGTGVILKTNDRPNCTKYPQILDLTQGVFTLFAPLSVGSLSGVTVTSVQKINPTYQKKFLRTDGFSGVRLISNQPNTYLSGELIEIAGRITDGRDGGVIRVDQGGKEVFSDRIVPASDGSFRMSFSLPASESPYQLFLSSLSLSQTQYEIRARQDLWVLDLSAHLYSGLPLSRLSTRPVGLSRDTGFGIQNTQSLFSEYTLSQDSVLTRARGKEFTLLTLEGFSRGWANLSTQSYLLSTPFSIDRGQVLPLARQRVFLERKYPIDNKVNAKVARLRSSTIISFTIPTGKKVQKDYFVTSPSGGVEKYTIDAKNVMSDGYLRTGQKIQLRVQTPLTGTYLIETVDHTGLAYFNIPVSTGTVWNVLEPLSLEMKMTLRKNLTLIRSSSIRSLNKLRAAQSLGLLSEDPDFTRMAQQKADDMRARSYLGHQDPDGCYMWDLFRTAQIPFSTVAENVAGGSIISGRDQTMTPISDIALVDGLELSGSHRMNMLLPRATKVGIGYATDGKKSYYVQVIGY